MVFSMNYSEVSPAKGGVAVSQVIDLAWVKMEDGRWALHLVGGSGLKGVRVRSSAPSTSARFTPGARRPT